MKLKHYIFEIAIITVFLLLINSCSSSSRYQILSTFFDGVPNPNSKKYTESDSLGVDSTNTSNNIANRRNLEPLIFYHSPYQERMCTECHDIDRGNKLVDSLPELCYNCHDDITSELKFVHGPVASGACINCHNPHQANMEFMLIRKGKDLCLYCHESNDIYSNKNHDTIEELNCQDCHNPHGGSDKYFLN